MKFNVICQHLGDRMYVPGDVREANEAEVKHLIGKVLVKPSTRVDANPRNKAVVPPRNKAQK